MKDIDIEFECISKVNDEISVAGCTTLNDLDNDDRPLQFYDNVGNLSWYVPSNPYPENRQPDAHIDYEILTTAFQTDDLFLQFLADFAEEAKTIEREDYILKINGGN